MEGTCNVENIYTIPPDCGYTEIDPYLKWEDTNCGIGGRG